MHAKNNPFIRLINEGRIKSLQELRSTYRSLIMKTHPDAVGSDVLIDKYLAFSSYYEEAKQLFEAPYSPQQGETQPIAENHRLAYYQVLEKLERIDKPYSFHRNENMKEITKLKSEAYSHFKGWNGEYERLYLDSDKDYDLLKTEKPSGPYMKHALAVNVSPVFHNIVAYHLTGIAFYKRQVKQNLKAVLQRLVDHECHALKGFIEVLIHDMENGPAVFAESRKRPRRKLLEQ